MGDGVVNRLSRVAQAVFGLALLGVLAHSLARFLEKAFAYLHSPFSRDYGEGCVLMMVQLLDERGSYFVSLRDYPFVHGNYPPLFIALVWPFYRLFGPSLFVPRLLSFLAAMGLLVVVYAIARRLGLSRAPSLVVTGVAFSPWFFQTWAPLARVDMLALLLSLAGLLAFVRGARAASVFPFFWLAFFTKQNALLAPAAVLCDIAASGDRRRVLRAALGFAVPLAVLFGAADLLTSGELFRHLVTYTAAAVYQWDRMGGSYVEYLRVSWPLLVMAAAGWRSLIAAPGRLFLIYWILNVAGLATIAKAGAAQNYFIEPWLATVLLAAAALPGIERRWPRPALLRTAALLVAAATAHYTSNWAHRLPGAIRHPERAQDFEKLWATVRAAEGRILSENLAVLVLHGKQVLVEPHGIQLLVRTGVFDPHRIVRDCEAGSFDLVIAEYRLDETPGVGECLARRYAVSEVLPPYRLLRPRPR